MPRLIMLCTLLSFAWRSQAFLPVAHAKKLRTNETTRVGVMPLLQGAGGSEYIGLGRALADMLTTDLADSPALTLVERVHLKLILDELNLAKSGFLDKRSAQKLGRGLGAEIIITGSYTVVNQKFYLNCHAISVATGTVIKGVEAEGKVESFVAVEKSIAQQLLSAIAPPLDLGAKRKLLIRSLTENAKALAKYGEALNLKEEGKFKSAEKAFAEALKSDPNFAKASIALAKLSESTDLAIQSESDRYHDARAMAIKNALKKIPSELSRPKNFKDTQETLIDFALRQALLFKGGEHCARYEELKHHLFRRGGDFESWYYGLSRDSRKAFEMGQALVEKRAKDLGMFGNSRQDKPRPFDWMSIHDIYEVFSAKRLTMGSGSVPFGRNSLGRVLGQCHTLAVQEKELRKLNSYLRNKKWFRQPLSFEMIDGKKVHSTIMPQDIVDLNIALVSTKDKGLSPKVEGLLAKVRRRHPVGSPKRQRILRYIESIVDEAKAFEKRIASRIGRSETTILEHLKAVANMDTKAIRLTQPVCMQLAQVRQRWAKSKLKDSMKQNSRYETSVDNASNVTAGLHYSHCFSSDKHQAMSISEILAFSHAALKRVHPERKKDSKCAEDRKTLHQKLASASSGNVREINGHLDKVHRLRTKRCLLP